MSKKRSVGTIIFGLLFLFMSYYSGLFSMGIVYSYSPSLEERAPEIIYRSLIKRITYIQKEARTNQDKLIRSGKKALFDAKFNAFKDDAENFKQEYIIQGNLLPNDKAFILIGFMTSVLYLLAGYGLLIHFLWARKLAIISACSNFLLVFVFFYQIYWILNFAQQISTKYFTLLGLLNPSAGPMYMPDQDAYKIVFLSPLLWIGFFIVFLYVNAVCFYFTRPKVKERFQ